MKQPVVNDMKEQTVTKRKVRNDIIFICSVLLIAVMGIVYLFLVVLIVTTKYSSAFVAKFDSILPQDAPKKSAKPAAANDDENIALAIAVAMG